MTVRESLQYLEHEVEIRALAEILNTVAEGSGANGGCVIAALTMLLAIWLDQAPEAARDEIRARVVAVLKGHIE